MMSGDEQFPVTFIIVICGGKVNGFRGKNSFAPFDKNAQKTARFFFCKAWQGIAALS